MADSTTTHTGKITWYKNRDGSSIGTDGDRVLGIVSRVQEFPVEAYSVESFTFFATPEAAQASLDDSYSKYHERSLTSVMRSVDPSNMSIRDVRDLLSDIVSVIDSRLKKDEPSPSSPSTLPASASLDTEHSPESE